MSNNKNTRQAHIQRGGLSRLSRLIYYLRHPPALLRRLAEEMESGFRPGAEQNLDPDKMFEKALFFRETGLIRPEDLVYDVGANIGVMTWAFLACGARVVSVEPNPICADYLQHQYGQNPKVCIVPKGLAAMPGELTLHYYPDLTAFGTFESDSSIKAPASHRRLRSTVVPVVTLDQVIREYGMPRFCKIDVEGFELEVLHGLSRPLAALSLEFHIDTLETTRACLLHLLSLGNYRFNYCYRSNYSLQLSEWSELDTVLEGIRQISATDPRTWGDIYVCLDQQDG